MTSAPYLAPHVPMILLPAPQPYSVRGACEGRQPGPALNHPKLSFSRWTHTTYRW